jgi:hypothetical protein
MKTVTVLAWCPQTHVSSQDVGYKSLQSSAPPPTPFHTLASLRLACIYTMYLCILLLHCKKKFFTSLPMGLMPKIKLLRLFNLRH